MRYSVADAKARLSELIRVARERNEVVITDRGRPVARLVAYREQDQPTLEERLSAFEEHGWLRPTADVSPAASWPAARRRSGGLARFLQAR